MFFYDRESIDKEFGKTGLVEIREVDDVYPFYLIRCRKEKKTNKFVYIDS